MDHMTKRMNDLSTKKSRFVKAGMVHEPTSLDVLCGRGRPFQNHSGNIRMRSIIKSHRNRYINSPHQEKFAIVIELVENVKRSSEMPARFLRRVGNGESSCWVEVDDCTAYDKVSHVLRNSKFRKEGGRCSDTAACIAVDIKKKQITQDSKNYAQPVPKEEVQYTVPTVTTYTGNVAALLAQPTITCGPSLLHSLNNDILNDSMLNAPSQCTSDLLEAVLLRRYRTSCDILCNLDDPLRRYYCMQGYGLWNTRPSIDIQSFNCYHSPSNSFNFGL